MKAICQRCGADKPGPLVPCRTCNHVPVSEERTLAWLLSDHHLSPAELEAAARRIRGGERPAPPEDLLAKARVGLQQAIPGRRRRQKGEKADGQTSPAPQEQKAPDAPQLDGATVDEVDGSASDARESSAPWEGEPNLRALLALDGTGPPGGMLPRWALWSLAAVCLLLTPLPGWITWWLWRGSAPKAARQVLWTTLPITVATALFWAVALAWAWSARWGIP